MKRSYSFLLLQLIWLVPIATAAQEATCPAIVEQALAATHAACSTIGRNQACYGNIKLSAESQVGVPDFNFSQPGDLADVAGIQSLTLSPLNQEVNTWGVAMMNIQANLPDTLPGQNVTFILFGDVQIQNAVPTNVQQTTLELTPNGTMNVRSGPSQSNPVIASLPGGQTVVTDGRNEAGDWLRIQLDSGDTGWVYAPLVMVDGDLQTLETVVAAALPALNPMQAFYFKTGALDSPCAEAPESGILVQNPNSSAKVNLVVNGVQIGMGSTIYIQAQPNGLMTINVLEGGVKVSLRGTAFVPAGARVQIQLDQNLNPVYWTGVVEPYDAASLDALPINLLPASLVIAAPVAEENLEAAQQAVAQTFPELPTSSAVRAGGCSSKGDTEATATFSNHSNRLVSVYWIDYQCHEVFYNSLPPGTSYNQGTYATHPWIVRDTITGALLAGPDVSASGEAITVTISG